MDEYILQTIIGALFTLAMALGLRWIIRVEKRVDDVEARQWSMLETMATKKDLADGLKQIADGLSKLEDHLRDDLQRMSERMDHVQQAKR